MALTILWLGLSTGAFVFGLGLTWWLHQHHQIGVAIPVTSAGLSGPLISIIVPARNEARNIRRCVVGLPAQAYPRLELLVVDDRSTDETPRTLAELARGDSRLTVIPSAPLPRGWVGVLFSRAQVARSLGLSVGYALTLPLGALIFGAMMFTSAFKVLSGRGVTWKGQTYADY